LHEVIKGIVHFTRTFFGVTIKFWKYDFSLQNYITFVCCP
jgi:hypothetical protein